MELLLVAEQNEDARVAWVWHWRPGFRAPRPLQNADEVRADLDFAEVCGASRAEVCDWIENTLK